jgi:hypothetical protein
VKLPSHTSPAACLAHVAVATPVVEEEDALVFIRKAGEEMQM